MAQKGIKMITIEEIIVAMDKASDMEGHYFEKVATWTDGAWSVPQEYMDKTIRGAANYLENLLGERYGVSDLSQEVIDKVVKEDYSLEEAIEEVREEA